MENYDSETGEYFWTEEEQAWVATHQAKWREMNAENPYEALKRVQRFVEKERVIEFEPNQGVPHYQTPFTIGDDKEELRTLRFIRKFNTETKTYKIVRIEKKPFGKRVWKDASLPAFRWEGRRLCMPGLRIFLNRGGGWKDAEFLCSV